MKDLIAYVVAVLMFAILWLGILTVAFAVSRIAWWAWTGHLP